MNHPSKAQIIIDREAQKWAEWLEMDDKPSETLNKILASKICLLEEEISYLRKFNHVGCRKS